MNRTLDDDAMSLKNRLEWEFSLKEILLISSETSLFSLISIRKSWTNIILLLLFSIEFEWE